MRTRAIGLALVVGIGAVTLSASGCVQPNSVRAGRRGLVDTGPGSIEATRKLLEGTWTLVSLEMVDGQGNRTPVKASGQLTYDDYSNMTVRGVVEDPDAAKAIVLEYQGRIMIDTSRHQFYPADLVSGRPVEPGQLPAIAPDKVRGYELSADAFVVTYLDAAAKPAAVARWRRP